MIRPDFVVKYDPEKDTQIDLSKRILYSLFIRRIKARKPVVAFVGGDSGEGKSYSILTIEDILLGMQNIDMVNHVDDVNVYTPLQYPEKIHKLLFDKELKKINMIAVHEARDVVKAKDWNKFITTAIADVNAQSRSIKRLCFFISSQFIRDITTDIRYTLNYYITVERPISLRKVKMYINVMWKDDKDLEKPKLKKRRIVGFIIYPDGRRRRLIPSYLLLDKPRKEIIEIFERGDKESKEKIIKRKLAKLMKELETDLGMDTKKMSSMIEFYTKNDYQLTQIGKFTRKGDLRLKREFREMHDLTSEEAKSFEIQLNKSLKTKGGLFKEVKQDDGND